MNEEELTQMEEGMHILSRSVRQFHFLAIALLEIAGGADAVEAFEIPDGSFATVPPGWAQGELEEGGSSRCAYCAAWMTLVRPGKMQCDLCCAGSAILLARILLKRMQDESNLVNLDDVASLMKQG